MPRLPGEVQAAYQKDPALRGAKAWEVLLYQGVWAIWLHRLANALWTANVPIVPRLVSQVARNLTGIDIHPGATIGQRCFIDHGSGVVIGETAVLGDDVMMYHGVTLGGHGWWIDEKGSKRHPTIGNNVTLAVGCSVLGAVTVGDNSKIGPNAVVVDDVARDSIIVAPRGRCLVREGVRVNLPDEDELVPSGWLEDYEMGGL